MRTIGVLLFEDFELLDVFGPLEMFGLLPDDFKIVMIAENRLPVRSKAGPVIQVDADFSSEAKYDIIMVPGGAGTRQQVNNPVLLQWLKTATPDCELVLTVCTGSLLLAKTGLLNGIKATTNKVAYQWVSSQFQQVNWQAQARWVEDGRYFTSSGVSAGMDMSLAVIAKLLGEKKAVEIANFAEYQWHRDSTWDPFAELNGLVQHG